jgi:glycosyltransferase involved in cell wall biosynthesis
MKAPHASPLVSVIISTRDRLSFLKEAVGSVMAQSLPSCEAVVVDDASSDETAAWLAGQSDERLTPIILEHHRGRSVACNRGFEQAHAELVLFLDDDDRLRPSALEQLSSALVEHEDAIGAIGARVLFNERGERRLPHPRRRLVRVVWPDLLAGWMSPPGTILWRSQAIRAAGGWNEQIMVGSGVDRELWLRAARGRPMVCIPEIVLEKRAHGGQWRALDARDQQERWMQALIDSWPPEDRAVAVRLSTAYRMLNDARIAYGNLETRAALVLYGKAIRAAPSLLRSPLMAPRIARGAAKSLAGVLTGRKGVLIARRAKASIRHALGRDVEEVKMRKSLHDPGSANRRS